MEGVGRGDPEEPGADGTAAVGTVVGRYQIVRRLGAGGMGVVFAARDHELDRMIALKLLRSAEQEGAAARLAREGKALAKLAHPNVVTVYDIGHHADELLIAMELVDGETLRAWLETPRSWRGVARVFLQAARGLAAAHRAGLVHRDFKPDNVLIDRAGTARVTDFGLARATGTADAAPASPSGSPDAITRSGTLAGTPAYMAPEQLLGRPVDARTDQWSFAVSLHEALSGKRPFSERVASAVTPVAAILADATAGRAGRPWMVGDVRTVMLEALARAFGGTLRRHHLRFVADGAEAEVAIDRALGGRIRATSIRVAADHAGDLAFRLPADRSGELLDALTDPDGNERRQRAYACLDTSEPRRALFWMFGPARWLALAPAYALELRNGRAAAQREGGEMTALALLGAIRAGVALAAGSDLLYEDWRALARALDVRIEDRGPWSGAAYSLSASMRGIQCVVDIGSRPAGPTAFTPWVRRSSTRARRKSLSACSTRGRSSTVG